MLVGDDHRLVTNPHHAPVARHHAVFAGAHDARLAAPFLLFLLLDAGAVVRMHLPHPQRRIGHPFGSAEAEERLDPGADVVPRRIRPEAGDVQGRRQPLDQRSERPFLGLESREAGARPVGRRDALPEHHALGRGEDHEHGHDRARQHELAGLRPARQQDQDGHPDRGHEDEARQHALEALPDSADRHRFGP